MLRYHKIHFMRFSRVVPGPQIRDNLFWATNITSKDRLHAYHMLMSLKHSLDTIA